MNRIGNYEYRYVLAPVGFHKFLDEGGSLSQFVLLSSPLPLSG